MNKPSCEKDQIQKIANKVSDKTFKEYYPLELQRTLHLIREHDLVGAMLDKAMERGEFDDLEGAGKPLDLNENPYEQNELHMVHKILKDNGFAPYWIELGKEVDVLRAKLNNEVDHFKKYTQMVCGEERSSGAIRRYEQKKHNFYLQTREHLEEISKQILDYNLNCPISSLGRANINIDDEMSRIVNDIEKSIAN